MPRKERFIQLPLAGKLFLCGLAIVYVVYLFAVGQYLSTWIAGSTSTITDHTIDATAENTALQHWDSAAMTSATQADEVSDAATDGTQTNVDVSPTKAGKQDGQKPRTDNAVEFPLSTVGKLFFSNASGQNMVCSGTAIVSSNHDTVDTAGHCLYWNNDWVRNVIFCPQYDHGQTPYGCWAAKDLEVPNEWINRPNNFYRDMGMVIVAPNSRGDLTNVVGGAGWAYNQKIEQPFYAYGYPAAYPFDGQSRKNCTPLGGTGKSWQFGGGTVVSIPCDMTGGSSGGPWFIKMNGKWYLSGHNDFISSLQRGHMFSPYYDDVWYQLYDKAQHE